MDLEKEISDIKLRNEKVETDKAWEVSLTRRLFICFATYIFAALWLVLIKDSEPLLKALVPPIGFMFSTLSLPLIKKEWLNKYQKRAP